MYLLDFSIIKEGEIQSLNKQEFVECHRHILSKSLKLVCENFGKNCFERHINFIFIDNCSAEIIGHITKSYIYDKLGNIVFDLRSLYRKDVYGVRYEFSPKNVMKEKFDTPITVKNNNAYCILSALIYFCCTSSKNVFNTKVAYMYDKKHNLLYKVDKNGIYDSKGNVLLDFDIFRQTKSYPKRLRVLTYKKGMTL